jgi:hypothetical protein
MLDGTVSYLIGADYERGTYSAGCLSADRLSLYPHPGFAGAVLYRGARRPNGAGVRASAPADSQCSASDPAFRYLPCPI